MNLEKNPNITELLNQPSITIRQFARVVGVSYITATKAVSEGLVDCVQVHKRKRVVTAPLRRKLGLEPIAA